MHGNWKDAVSSDVVRFTADQTIENARQNFTTDYALIEDEGQPIHLISAQTLADLDLPSENTLKQNSASLPPLVIAYAYPYLSIETLTQQAQAIMLEFDNLAGIVVMDDKGKTVEGVLKRETLVSWIAGETGNRLAKGYAEASHDDAHLAGIPELPLVKYTCPKCGYAQYLLSPPENTKRFCSNHPDTPLQPEAN
jgi:hypothetical protein